MRFGISATSLICPKNLRTRLRPVNVCCAIVASHFAACRGGPSKAKLASRFGLKFHSFRIPADLNLRTQNDVRSAATLCPSESRCYGLQKPEIVRLPLSSIEIYLIPEADCI